MLKVGGDPNPLSLSRVKDGLGEAEPADYIGDDQLVVISHH